MTNILTMIDLFAGIGGIRLGFENAAKAMTDVDLWCTFSSEWDRFAQDTYEANHGDRPAGDITDPAVREEIEDFDLLLAGFPCQPFSLAGVSKKNALGRPHGFDDPTQGTLFHEIVEIIRDHQPKAFLLENVKHLQGHDGGRTFAVIAESLTELGYSWDWGVRNASLKVPQNRERIYFVGYRRDLGINAKVPEIQQKPNVAIWSILHEFADEGLLPTTHWNRAPSGLDRYELSDNLWGYLQRYAAKHRAAGNGFGFGLVNDLDGISRTLSARYHKDGSEILIPQSGRNPRRLTPRECARLQGFPEDFRIVCSDTQAYRQFGNSVAVPIIEAIASSMLDELVGALSQEQVRAA